MFYGNPRCAELFASFSSVWRLRSGEAAARDPEWRRRLQLVLGQLRVGTTLTRAYSLYHGLGLGLDLGTLALLSLYSLHYWGAAGPNTRLFPLARSEDGHHACHVPNKHLYKWLGLAAVLVTALKVRAALLCRLTKLT